MADPFVESHIKALPLFGELPQEQIELVADAFQVEQYDAGEYIFRQGEPSRGLYVFVDGRGTLVRSDAAGNTRPIGSVDPNKFLNESSLFNTAIERASLYADAPSLVLVLERDTFKALLTHHPELKANLKIRMGDQRTRIVERVFEGQLDNESVLIITHRHPWVFVRLAWLPLLIVVLCVVGIVVGGSFWVSLLLFMVMVALPVGIMLYFYLEWRNDRIIVTTRRIIREEHNIVRFSSNVSKVPLESIQEINADIPKSDPFARLFNYGTVELKTAGTAGNIVLDMVPNPDGLQQLIFRHRERVRQESVERDRSVIRAEVDRALGLSPDQPQAAASPAPQTAAQKTPPDSAKSAPLNPLRLKFINQEGEIVYRKHWIVWLAGVFLPSMVIAGGVILLLLCLFLPILREIGLAAVLFALFVIFIGGVWFYLADWDWRHDMYIVGTDSIRLIHRRPLWLANQVDQVLLSRVDNVTANQRGLINTLFNVGDVRISLVGADAGEAKVFGSVFDPKGIQEEISRIQARMKAAAQENELRRQREVFSEYISAYHQRAQQVGNMAAGVDDEDIYGAQGVAGVQPPAQGWPASNLPPRPTPSSTHNPAQPTPLTRDAQQGGEVPPLQDRIRPPHVPRPRKPG